jgi:tetratricopeptide (TPR) repeat protein
MKRALFHFYRRALFAAALVLLPLAAVAQESALSPQVLQRFEQMLEQNPAYGAAFDKVYQHYLEGEGLDALDRHWLEAAKAEGKASSFRTLRGLLALRRGQVALARDAFKTAAEQDPKNHQAWMALADLEASEGKMAEAVEAYRKALELELPAVVRPEAYRKLARSQQRALDAAGALETLKKMAAEFPDDPFALEEAGQAMLEAEAYPEAEETFAKLRDLVKNDPQARASATLRLGELAEAREDLDKALGIYESLLPETSEDSWVRRTVRGRIEDVFRRRDDLPGLAAYYLKRLETHKREADTMTALAEVLRQLGRTGEALEWTQKAAELSPDRPELQLALARQLMRADSPDAARKAGDVLAVLRKKWPQREDYIEAHGEALWSLFEKSKNPEDRAKALEAWNALAPGERPSPQALARLGELLRRHHADEEGVAALRKAVEAAPDQADLRENLAGYLVQLERGEEARQVLDGLVEGSRSTAANWLRLARDRQRYDTDERALQAVEKGLELEKGNFELLGLKASLLADAKKWDEAIALYPEVVAAAPNSYFKEDAERRHIALLRQAGRLEAFRNGLHGRLQKGDALDETDTRLLLRSALETGADDIALEALAHGKERYPESSLLAQLEVQYQRRIKSVDGQVAALKRLIALEPKRKQDWMRDMAQVLRAADRAPEALKVAEQMAEAFPASADALQLAADLHFSMGEAELGIEKLRRAVRLSEHPNDLRLRLATVYFEQGKPDQALRMYEEAFESEEEFNARLGLIRPMAEGYSRAGRLSELIERFQQRQRGERGTARYSLYLAEIYRQTEDYDSARRELSKVLAAKGEDAALLKQLIFMASVEGDTQEEARYYRQLAGLEPSARNAASLVRALLESGESEEALAELKEHGALLEAEPEELYDLLDLADDEEIIAELIRMVEAGLAKGDPAQGRLMLAEALLRLQRSKEAEAYLWQIWELPEPDPSQAPASAAPKASAALVPPSASTPVPLVSGGTGRRAVISGFVVAGQTGTASRSVQLSNLYYQARQRFEMLQMPAAAMAQRYGRAYRSRSNQMSVLSGSPSRSGTGAGLERYQALVYLGCLAQAGGREKEFVAELDRRLGAAKAGADGRLKAYGVLDAPTLIFPAVEQYLETPSVRTSEMDQLSTYLLQRSMGGVLAASQVDRLLPLLEKLSQQQEQTDPVARCYAALSQYQFYARYGRGEQRKQRVLKALEDLDPGNPQHLQAAASAAMQLKDWERVEQFCQKMEQDPQLAGQAQGLQMALLQQWSADESLRPRAAKLADGLLADLLAGLFAQKNIPASWAPQADQAPGPNRLVPPQEFQQLFALFSYFRAQNRTDVFRQILKREREKAAKADGLLQTFPEICALWWESKRKESVELFASRLDGNAPEELRLMAAQMAGQAKEYARAHALLKPLLERSDAAGLEARLQEASWLRLEKKKDEAAALLTQLAKAKLPPEVAERVQNELSNAGLQELSNTLRAGAGGRRGGAPRSREQELYRQLQEFSQAKEWKKAVDLARRILATNPLPAFRTQNTGTRSQALQLLREQGELKPYVEGLEGELKKSPGSLRLHLLLAEGLEMQDSGRSAELLKKIAALRPKDAELRRMLARKMMDRNLNADAREIYLQLMKEQPVWMLQQENYQLIRLYKEDKRLPELARLAMGLPISGNSSAANLQGVLQNIGQELARSGDKELACEVYRRCEVLYPGASDARQRRLALLLELDKKDEVRQALLDLFVPTPFEPPLLFASQPRQFRNTQWLLQVQNRNEETFLQAEQLVSLAGEAGLLPDLKQSLEKGEGAAAGAEGEELVLKVSRILVLSELGEKPEAAALAWVADPAHYPPNLQGQRFEILRALAARLADRGPSREEGFRLLEQCRTVADENRQNYWQRMMVRRQLISLSEERGNRTVAGGYLQEAAQILQEQMASQNNSLNESEAFSLLDAAIRNDQPEAAKSFAALIRQSPNVQRNRSYQRRLERCESELDLIAGSAAHPAALAWALPPAQEGGPAQVFWEIGVPDSDDNDSRPRYLLRGAEVKNLDRKFDIEVLYGENQENMRRLFRIEKGPGRGTAAAALPKGAGWLRVLLYDRQRKDVVHVGQPVPVAVGGNALPGRPELRPTRDEDSDAEGKGSLRQHAAEEGLFPGSAAWAVETSGQSMVLAGGSVDLQPGRTYAQAAWIYADSEGRNVSVGRRFLDAEGKVLNTSYASVNTSETGRRWQLHRQVLTWGNARNDEIRIPENAKKMEWLIRAYGPFRMAGAEVVAFDREDAED